MPTARESLLDAALAALAERPWSAVRMVDVAVAAGLSRQTLYNEFGSKDGLGRALVRREADGYLRGVDRLLGEGSGAVEPLVAIAEWTVSEARARPLLRALLTGCWGEWLPLPTSADSDLPPAGTPAQRRADAGAPRPAEVVALVRDRSLAALTRGGCGFVPEQGGRHQGEEEPAALAHRCELTMRLALSCVIAPAGEGVGRLIRTAVGSVPAGGDTEAG